MHFYFLSIFVSLKKPQCGGRCSAEPKEKSNILTLDSDNIIKSSLKWLYFKSISKYYCS